MSRFFDDFSRADENPLRGLNTWDTNTYPPFGQHQVVSHQLTGVSNTADNVQRQVALILPADQYAEMDVIATDVTTDAAMLLLRMAVPPTTTWYGFGVSVQPGRNDLIKFVAGVFTLLVMGGTHAPGDHMRFEVYGQTLNGYVNGVLQATTTDPDVLTGQSGIDIFTALPSGTLVDNYVCGSFFGSKFSNAIRPRAFAPGIAR